MADKKLEPIIEEVELSVSDEEKLLEPEPIQIDKANQKAEPPSSEDPATSSTTETGISPLLRPAATIRPKSSAKSKTEIYRTVDATGKIRPICFKCKKPGHVSVHCRNISYYPPKRLTARMSTGGARRCIRCNRQCFISRVCPYCCLCFR